MFGLLIMMQFILQLARKLLKRQIPPRDVHFCPWSHGRIGQKCGPALVRGPKPDGLGLHLACNGHRLGRTMKGSPHTVGGIPVG